MDEELQQLLQGWGVEETYIQKLKAEEIYSMRDLLLLDADQLKIIFTTIGSLGRFQRKLKEFKVLKSIEDTNTTEMSIQNNADIPASSAPVVVVNNSASVNRESNGVGVSTSLSNTRLESVSLTCGRNDDSLPSTSSNTQPQPRSLTCDRNGESVASTSNTELQPVSLTAVQQTRKRHLDPSDVISDLASLLESGSGMDGKLILSEYKGKKKLTESLRDSLCDIILNEFLKDDYDRKLTYDGEAALAAKILEVFPTELKDFWVSPLSHNRRTSTGRGKLLSCYYSKRRKLHRCNLLSKNDKENAENPDEELEAEDNESLLWLMNNQQPWTDVTQHWKDTSQIRMRRLCGGTQTVHEYMEMYPALLDNTGYLLFEIDFESHFDVSGLSLYAEWPKLSAFIESKVPDIVLQGIRSSTTPQGRKVRTLLALPHLFTVVTVCKKRGKQWRPSRTEVADAFLFQARVAGDIDGGLNLRHRTHYEPFGIAFPPQAIAVGADPDSISQSYVRVNKTLYPVTNPLKAVDVTFKAMHALDAEYHKEATREWLFLERAVYQVNLHKEKDVFKMKGLLQEYSNFVPPPAAS